MDNLMAELRALRSIFAEQVEAAETVGKVPLCDSIGVLDILSAMLDKQTTFNPNLRDQIRRCRNALGKGIAQVHVVDLSWMPKSNTPDDEPKAEQVE